MRLLILICLLMASCSKSIKNNNPINNSINYFELNSFVKDSMPISSDLNSNYNQVFVFSKYPNG